MLAGILFAVPIAAPAQTPAQTPAQAPAQAPALTGARVTVRVPADGSGPLVDATYTFAGGAATDTVPLRTPEFAGARAAGIETRADGDSTLQVRYRVDRPAATGDGRFDLVVPLVLPDVPPTAAPEDFFTAEVNLPADWAVVEAFPTVPRGVTAEGAGTRHTFTLQVAPAMLRLRGRIGEPPVVTFGRVVDLATAGVVLLLSVLGYLALRRGAASDARAGRGSGGRTAPGSADGARQRGIAHDPAPPDGTHSPHPERTPDG